LTKLFVESRLSESCESSSKNRLNKSFTENRLNKSSIENRLNKSSPVLLFAFTKVLSWEFLTFAFVTPIANNIEIEGKNKDATFEILLFTAYVNTFRGFSLRNRGTIILML